MAQTLVDRLGRYGPVVTVEPPRRVVVLFGGQSSEHSISCLSAAGVLQALNSAGFATRAIGITRSGRWLHQDPSAVIDAARVSASTGILPEVLETGEAFLAPAQPGVNGGLDDIADVVFPVLHGPWGEDGTVQGILEFIKVPYVGSGVLASAVAMHKATTKALLSQAGLPVGAWFRFNHREWQRDPEPVMTAIDRLEWPVFVKPARAGSSVGITRVSAPEQLGEAINEAQRWDQEIIIETAVTNAREIECGVISGGDGQPVASRSAEIIVGGDHEFYDFDAKYVDSAATLIVPADVTEDQEEIISDLSCRAFTALGCEGLARVDFFVSDSAVVINEVNTMPGFTPISLFPQMWAASGMNYTALVAHLVNDALRRGTGLR